MWGSGIRRLSAYTLLAIIALTGVSGPAAAHGAERGFVLLLPTGHFIVGGAIAVAISFMVIIVIPAVHLKRFFAFHRGLGEFAWPPPVFVSTLSAVLLAAAVLAGFRGSRDPLENLLPLTVWTVWWTGIALLHAVAGHLWLFLNPFLAPSALMARFITIPFTIPRLAAYAPALPIFLLFAWCELVAPAPDDPGWLATVVTIYAFFTLAAACATGPGRWFAEYDPFAIFFRLIGAAAPIQLARSSGRTQVNLRCPGAGLVDHEPLPVWGVFFVLLTLSSVSFDGFSNTFFWLALGGINPLDFPGRTAVIGYNTFGLLASFAILATIFIATVSLGWVIASRAGDLRNLLGRLVLSLIPISIAFHFAHYLPDLLVKGQYVVLAFNDPLSAGWNLFGFADYQVTTSFLNTAGGSRAIYFVQTAAIVSGHIVGVAVAHLLLLGAGVHGRHLMLLETPLALLMVGYTAFGLWVLSSPSIG
jgi:hypothetical protein